MSEGFFALALPLLLPFPYLQKGAAARYRRTTWEYSRVDAEGVVVPDT